MRVTKSVFPHSKWEGLSPGEKQDLKESLSQLFTQINSARRKLLQATRRTPLGPGGIKSASRVYDVLFTRCPRGG